MAPHRWPNNLVSKSTADSSPSLLLASGLTLKTRSLFRFRTPASRFLLPVLLALLVNVPRAVAQNRVPPSDDLSVLANSVPSTDSSSRNSSDLPDAAGPNGHEVLSRADHTEDRPTVSVRPFSAVGASVNVGVNGIGFDIASPLSRRFNLRAGMDFFRYNTSFADQGANISLQLQLRSVHTDLDFYPFGNGFRVSPLLVFANNNIARGSVLVPPGSTITLDGTDFISDPTDPLRGGGSIGFRKVAPGLTIGEGNILPRSGRHLSFPVEIGFYYVGQPTLKVNFTGSACNPQFPLSVGCESVDQDPSFQKNLAAFINRNNKNLQYAKFFPVLSVGIGYSF